MPKIVDYDEKRNEIIQSATDVFIREGYYRTNLSTIAKECGMGRTTLYQYFENKEEIFLCSVQYIFNLIIDDCKNVLDDPDLYFLDKIKRIFYVLASYSKKSKNKMLIIGELSLILHRKDCQRIEEEQKMFTSTIVGKFKYLLQGGIHSKEIKDMDVDSMSYTLYTMVKSLLFHSTTPSGIDSDEYLSNINLLIDGLKA